MPKHVKGLRDYHCVLICSSGHSTFCWTLFQSGCHLRMVRVSECYKKYSTAIFSSAGEVPLPVLVVSFILGWTQSCSSQFTFRCFCLIRGWIHCLYFVQLKAVCTKHSFLLFPPWQEGVLTNIGNISTTFHYFLLSLHLQISVHWPHLSWLVPLTL